MSHERRETEEQNSEDRRETDGQPADEETYGAVTWFEAVDADQQSLLLGQFNRIQEIAEPEETDQGVLYVRREFEPVRTIPLQGEVTRDEARSWIRANRQHQGFDGYDWRSHDRRELLGTIVDTRSNHLQRISNIYDQLEAVPIVSVTADERISEIMGGIADVLTQTPPTMIDATESADQSEQSPDRARNSTHDDQSDDREGDGLQPEPRDSERRDS